MPRNPDVTELPGTFPAAGRAGFMISGSYDHLSTGTARDHDALSPEWGSPAGTFDDTIRAA
jgi:hypothetical protein